MRAKHMMQAGCFMLATNGVLAQEWDQKGNMVTFNANGDLGYVQQQYAFDGSWSGQFAGVILMSAYQPSDEILKMDIEPIEEPLEVITQLQPKRYSYRNAGSIRMHLPEGEQYGFLAGEVAEVLPGIVANASLPEELDSLGNVIADRMDFQAINYTGLIPYLVAGMQEQQTTIALQRAQMDQQNARLDQLEQLLTETANQPANEKRGGEVTVKGSNEDDDGVLRIQPNPFNESVAVFFTLEHDGRARLLAKGEHGKDLHVLQDAELEAGSYQYQWSTADLAVGVYNVSLLLDGKPVEKKVVSVAR